MKVTTFRERFSDLIDESGKTLTSIAKDLHVSNQTISAWRTGVRSPKAPTILTIANYFGVTVEWLMGFDFEKMQKKEDRIPIVVPDSERFVKLVRYMPQDEYLMVMNAFSRAEKRLKEAEESK